MIVQQNRLFNIQRPLITSIFSVFFVLLPLLFNNQIIETASLPRHIFTSGVACLLLFLFALQLFTHKQTKLQFSQLHLILLVFFGWALLSLTWTIDPKNTYIEFNQLTSYFVIVFISSLILNLNQIKKILIAIYLGASIAAVIGIIQAFNFNPLELKSTTALASTFNNKNHASVYFDLVIPLALISMFTTQSYAKYISSIAYTLGVTFILLAKTKGSILGYLVFMLFFIFLIVKYDVFKTQFIQKKKIIHFFSLTLFIPFLIYFTATSNISETKNKTVPALWNAGLTEKSSGIRLSWYKNAYAMFKENPLTGVGYGAFRKGFAPYASSPNIVTSVTEDRSVAQLHNDPFQNILELGLIGGVIIILFFSYIFIRYLSTTRSLNIINKDHSEYLLMGCILALISSTTHSFVDFPMRLPSSAVLFWFVTGLTILLLNRIPANNKISLLNYSVKNKKTGTAIIGLLFILLSIHNINLYSRYYSASKLQYEATVLIINGKKTGNTNCPAARLKIDQAISLFFESHSIRHRYAQIYSYCDVNTEIKVKAMNRVLNYDSSHTRARLTRALLYMEQKKYKLAYIDFKYLIQILPHRPSAYLGLGDIETLAKNYTVARQYYERAQKLDPANKQAKYMLKQYRDNNI